MNFERYQHIERYGNDEVDGLTDGECHIFSKLDGTNGSVWLGNDGEIKAGSRNRQLTLDNDNAGFYHSVIDDENLKNLVTEHPEYRLYGEWLVPHQVKNYNPDAWKRFYVFDVMDENGNYMPYEHYVKILVDYGIPYIPLLRVISNPDASMLKKCLVEADFLLPTGSIGEGIVIKNYDFVNKYGRKTWGKLISDEYIAAKHVKTSTATVALGGIEKQIVEEFLTDAFIEKEKAKIEEYHATGWKNQYIPELFGHVWHEFIDEELFNILKKKKNPKIDFTCLNKLVMGRVKQKVL